MPISSAAVSSVASTVVKAASSAASASVAASSSVMADTTTYFKPFTPDAIANGFATLVGALLGAMLAYMLQRHFQKQQDRRNDLLAAHRLMFSLLQQINSIVLIQQDFVYSELSNPTRFLSIPALPPFDTNKNVLQAQDLAFLLGTKQSRLILYDFYLAQESYIEALSQLNMRSSLHFEKIQPALAASGIKNGTEVTIQDLRNALGEHLFGSILNSTDNCIKLLSLAFRKLAKVKLATRAHLVDRFKTTDFTDFDVPNTYGLDATEQNNHGTHRI